MIPAGILAAAAPRTISPVSGYYLGEVSVGFESVLSLRRLVESAAVSIRVRRASDSAESDIGFDGDTLDVAALLAFAAGGSAFARRIYDQSGGGRHAEQPVSTAQPRIVNAGVFDEAIKFDGIDDFMIIEGMSFGTPHFSLFERIYQPPTTASRIIAEASNNFNSAAQAFLHYGGNVNGPPGVSLNSSNAAGQQRANQYAFAQTGPETITCAIDRDVVGIAEVRLFRNGTGLSPDRQIGGVEQTGVFNSYPVYLGARGGTTLFNDMEVESLVFTSERSLTARSAIENALTRDPDSWRERLNAPVVMQKIGNRYFIADCWHHRILFSDDPEREIWAWDTLDESTLRGPHSVASDGVLLVVDNTDIQRVEYYDASTMQHLGSVSGLGSRPHRVVYDSGTDAFYVIRSGVKTVVKLVRAGTSLSIDHSVPLNYLGGYVRSFRIIDGEMVFISDNGTIHTVAFDGTSSGYALTGTYSLPSHMTDCNDVFKASSGKWYATSWDPAMIEFDSLAGVHSGIYTDIYASWGITGVPYWIEEFDGALWIGNIIEHNGILKRQGGVTTTIHDFGEENASSYQRHHNP